MFSVAGILAGLAIIVLVGCIVAVTRYSRRSGSDNLNADNSSHNRLTRFVKRFLDIALAVILIGAILWPITALGVGLNLFFDTELRNVDVFLGFKIESEILPEGATGSASAKDTLMHGHSQVQISTPSQFAWYLSAAISEFLAIILLYGLLQLRAMFASLTSGVSFAEENPARINKIGLTLICWYVVTPFLQYFGGRAVLSDIELSVQGIQLYPAFELGIAGIFVGLAIIVLAGVLREATNIHKDQSLTI